MRFDDREKNESQWRHTLDESDHQDRLGGPAGHSLNPAVRIIGASCGAFVLCFIAIIFSSIRMEQLGEQTARLVCVSALVCGAVGGFVFPRLGHFLGYGFLFFMNVTLSLMIARNVREQVLLFAIFAFIEFVFFLSRGVMSSKRT